MTAPVRDLLPPEALAALDQPRRIRLHGADAGDTYAAIVRRARAAVQRLDRLGPRIERIGT